MAAEVALALRHVSKSFGGTRALDNVDLTLLPGEILGLLGANGSGKSTLVKILAGYHAPELGAELKVGGSPEPLPIRPGRARELGVSFVHQHLGLIPSLSIVENFCLSELAGGNVWRISWRDARARAQAALHRYGLDLDPRQTVAELRPRERALLAIARADAELSTNGGRPRILVLDEPTVFLAEPEAHQLFEFARRITAGGGSAVIVSHKLDQVLELADRVTVLSDGRVVGTFGTAGLERNLLAEIVAGRPLEGAFRPTARAGRVAVSVEGLATESLSNLSFNMRAGEVLGLTGLAGSGFDEVPYHLFGARKSRGGFLRLDDSSYDIAALTPDRAVRSGMALLPADRLRDGAIDSLPVEDNVMLPILDRYGQRFGLDRSRMLRDAAALLERFAVSPAEPSLPFGALSGGNQQKALIAKALNTMPRLLLLDDPTQGVDVGARAEILILIRQAAAAGSVVLCVSPDPTELAAFCDRVMVVVDGHLVAWPVSE